MPAKVMRVVTAAPHPNADALRVYEMEANGVKTQIIANLENVYQVGDLVNVVQENSILKDGTRLKEANLRGLPSHGMALGPAAEGAHEGDDLTDQFCQPLGPQHVQVVQWPEIVLLHNLVRGVDQTGIAPRVRYRAKVKLDGTNGGVQIFPTGDVFAQTRTSIVVPGDDHYGFAAWVEKNKKYFSALKKSVRLVIFGEWCGRGIQKRTAISQIDRKILVVFALQLGGDDGTMPILECEPESIRLLLPEHPDIFVLPWHQKETLLDFKDKDKLRLQAELINEMVADVEKCDPWVKETFGIEGLGEGLVLYPLPGNGVTFGRDFYSDWMFKAKGDKHKVVNTKKPAQIDPEFVATVDNFVNLFATEARLEQGLAVVCGGAVDVKRTGDFVKWFAQDVQKESKDELVAAGLEWKQVAKAINLVASKWFTEKVKEL
jgi:tRNA-binding EMAP/Myf-like protein